MTAWQRWLVLLWMKRYIDDDKFKLEATTTQTASQTIEKQQNENILKNDAFEMIPIALVRCFNHPCLGYNDDWNNTLTNGCMEKKQ